jgi:hypothetical protein
LEKPLFLVGQRGLSAQLSGLEARLGDSLGLFLGSVMKSEFFTASAASPVDTIENSGFRPFTVT